LVCSRWKTTPKASSTLLLALERFWSTHQTKIRQLALERS